MSLATIRAQLSLHTAQFTRALNGARRQVHRFSSDLAMAARANEGLANRMVRGYTSLNSQLRKVGLSLRDITRVSSGVLIASTFYRTTEAIQNAAGALWEFNEALDYAQVTYSALFGSTDLANDFISTLKDYSVETIFEYADLEGMARKLLAYGIEYKNLMFLIEGLTNIGTLSGDAAALERLAVAIGQINAKGTLKAEEIRQLTNAYAPMYDILESKLGLSGEQLNSIGDLQIPAYQAINAIVEYANEKFGDVATAAMFTITGLNNRIVDSLKVMGQEMLAPLTNFYKALAFEISEQLQSIHKAFRADGFRGVLAQLIPSEEWQARISTLLNSIKSLVTSIIAALYTLMPYFTQIFGGLINGFSVVISIISGTIRALTAVFQTMAANTAVINILTKALIIGAAAWAVFRLQGLATAALAGVRAVIVAVANAVLFLAKAILANPILTMILLIGAALTGFAASASGANNAFTNLINSFNSFTAGDGLSSDLGDVNNALGDGAHNADQFWDAMEDGATDAEGALNDAGNAAKKAAKGLLSFDEVFKLNQNGGGAGGSGMPSIDFDAITDGIGGLGGALLPEIPDFSDYAKNFTDGLFGSLWESVRAIASGGATGALIGGLVGFAIGGLVTKTMAGALGGAKIGAKIGTIAGAGFAAFWTDTYLEMEKSLVKIATGGAIGLLIGGLTGMVIGAFATRTIDGALIGARLGAGIGGLLGAGLGGFWAGATEEMSSAIEGLIVGGATGALIGGLVGLVIGAFSTRTLQGALAGAILGVKIGALVGAGLGAMFGSFSDELKRAIIQATADMAMGALIGGLGGFILGAFVTRTLPGALAGARLGAAIGAIMGLSISPAMAEAETAISDAIGNLGSTIEAAGIGALIGGLAGMIIGGIVGAFAGGIGALPGAKAGATLGAAIGGLGGMLIDYLNNAGIFEALGQWFSDLGASIGTWLSTGWANITAWSTKVWSNITGWFTDLGTSISTWFTETKTSIKNWWNSWWQPIANGWTTGWDAVTTWFSDLGEDVETWFKNAKASVKTWWSNLWQPVANGWTTGWNSVGTWFTDLKTYVSNWFSNTKASAKEWWGSLWRPGANGWTTGWNSVSTWFTDLKTYVGNWFSNTKASAKEWWDSLWDPVANMWSTGWSAVSSWFDSLTNDISNWFTSLGSKVSTWWNNLWKGKKATVTYSENGATIGPTRSITGYATGGIVSRDQIARVAEGNKREAIIPLEDSTAMQPFSDAVSNGILQTLLPALANTNGSSNSLPPLYVGTLVADERGLQQLFKKFEMYEAKEMARKGLA